MKLIPAPGSVDMQQASSHSYVHEIVNLLLALIEQDLFREVALFLRNYSQKTQFGFSEKLQALHIRRRPDDTGNYAESEYIKKIIQILEKIYDQEQRKIDFQRGAIVELLAKKLVARHCNTNECFDNQRFIGEQSKYTSDQVDVAVFSEKRQQIEGYTCKINCQAILSEDCTNLTALADEAEKQGYDAYLGAVSFDNSRLIHSRISKIPSLSRAISPYGINNIIMLQMHPF